MHPRLLAVLFPLLRGDIRVQFKYGIHLLYAFFTGLYLVMLSFAPEPWRKDVAAVLIFTDPAAMGMFFMGALVLFEKSERVLDSLAVSPVTPKAYVLSKLGSIGCTATMVGGVISVASHPIAHPMLLLAGVFLGSCLFSSIALILAGRASSLNRFLLAGIPAEILVVTPALVWMFAGRPAWGVVHPGVAVLMLCIGANSDAWAILSLCVWTSCFVMLAFHAAERMMRTQGGAAI